MVVYTPGKPFLSFTSMENMRKPIVELLAMLQVSCIVIKIILKIIVKNNPGALRMILYCKMITRVIIIIQPTSLIICADCSISLTSYFQLHFEFSLAICLQNASIMLE